MADPGVVAVLDAAVEPLDRHLSLIEQDDLAEVRTMLARELLEGERRQRGLADAPAGRSDGRVAASRHRTARSRGKLDSRDRVRQGRSRLRETRNASLAERSLEVRQFGAQGGRAASAVRPPDTPLRLLDTPLRLDIQRGTGASSTSAPQL